MRLIMSTNRVGAFRSILSTVTNLILLGRTWAIWGRNRVLLHSASFPRLVAHVVSTEHCDHHGHRNGSYNSLLLQLSFLAETDLQERCMHGVIRRRSPRTKMALRRRQHGMRFSPETVIATTNTYTQAFDILACILCTVRLLRNMLAEKG
jgi:hypothetical protein